MDSTLKIYEKFADWPIGRVLGFTTIYETNELLIGEVYLFRENAKDYMATKTIKIPIVTAKITNFNMQAELLRYINSFYKHDIFYPTLNIEKELKDNEWETFSFYEADYENYNKTYRKIKVLTKNEKLKSLLDQKNRAKKSTSLLENGFPEAKKSNI